MTNGRLYSVVTPEAGLSPLSPGVSQSSPEGPPSDSPLQRSAKHATPQSPNASQLHYPVAKHPAARAVLHLTTPPANPHLSPHNRDAGLASQDTPAHRLPPQQPRITLACRHTFCGCRRSASGSPRASPWRALWVISTCLCAQTSCCSWMPASPPANITDAHLLSHCVPFCSCFDAQGFCTD